ncbi:Uncharacterised protein [Phocoenobacter uteri]|uniref:Lipoprotein n=1 Tax=Phocoenobacter uteri TaxID=146806 RepID=A0A379CA23_9PAST|nr:hypothetical protein [Phocoenobacter uteri]MDG6881148.1 hypothetical protein [Phocoenobacter uteri]SUB59170.1 Uncharacterised protein [Phocoenobacter uteri]
MKYKYYFLLVVFFLTSCCIDSSSCIAVKFWDGYYSRENASKEFDKEEQIFYDNESPNKKLLRKKNEAFCDELTPKLFEQKKKYDKNDVVNMSDIFVYCMRINNTPIYLDLNKNYNWLIESDVKR